MNAEKKIELELETRPWGNFSVIQESQDFKIKKIEVNPSQRLSYQRHSKRSEHWYVISGEALVTLDSQEIIINKNSSVNIPCGVAHRVKNTSNTEKLIFIEIQTGSYFGEDDIERLSDDYSRA